MQPTIIIVPSGLLPLLVPGLFVLLCAWLLSRAGRGSDYRCCVCGAKGAYPVAYASPGSGAETETSITTECFCSACLGVLLRPVDEE